MKAFSRNAIAAPIVRCTFRRGTLVAASAFLFAAGTPVMAQTAVPSVEFQTTSFMVGIGGQSGDGWLRLPNLGTNCAYPITVDGFGAGVQVDFSQVSASGPVANLTNLAQFPGYYSAVKGDATVFAGGGGISMKNQATPVAMSLTSQTAGFGAGIGGQSVTVGMTVPPEPAQRVYVLEFGFNKANVGEEARAALAQAINGWKCRFVNISLVGHTDTVGKEDSNLGLSDLRAKAVLDYLIQAGVAPNRIAIRAVGENYPLVPTSNDVRLRANRAVVLTIM